MQPLTPRNTQIARKFPSIELLNSVRVQTTGYKAPLGRDGQFKGPLMDPKPLDFLYIDEDTLNCVISTITSQAQCCIVARLYVNHMFCALNFSKPAGNVMHHQVNIQQLYVLPTLYLCVLYLSENKQRRAPLTA
jgi:hypothetical protein